MVGVFELLVQPTEKGTKYHPYVANRFGRHRFFTTIEARLFEIGALPGHVAGQVRWLDLGNTPISNIVQPMVEHEFIGGDCALA